MIELNKKLFFVKIFLVSLLFLSQQPIFAGWQYVGETPTARYFTDMVTIKATGFKRTVMMYQNLKFKRTKDGAVSIIAQLEYDCRKKMHRMISAKAYPGPNMIGDVLKSKIAGVSWNPTYKISRFMFTAVCAIPNSGKLEFIKD